MQVTSLYKRIKRIPKRIVMEARLLRLSLFNRWGRARVTRGGAPAVSLTSYGMRINTVYLTIESIGRGSILPSRIVLWLDDKEAFEHPPATLRRLVRRGLEIKLCRNYGPHTKYYPYVNSEDAFTIPLITADDDVLYPRYWLKRLVRAYRDFPEFINCYFARVISFNGNEIAEYAKWPFCKSTEPYVRNVGMGYTGVIYPPHYLQALKAARCGFEECCPKADDIWLHVQAVRAGIRVRQIASQEIRFPVIPGTEAGALHMENHRFGNDRQVKLTYMESDIELLRSEPTQQDAD